MTSDLKRGIEFVSKMVKAFEAQRDALKSIQKILDKKNLTDDQIEKLSKNIGTIIYGNTVVIDSLKNMINNVYKRMN